ncbi:MAG: LysM peptidoglycan-binding domain-containing protein, partial [Pseudomonadota bacterium]
MKLWCLPIAAALLITPMAERASAQALACGGEYVIKAGDTVSKVSRRVYGNDVPYQILFSANSDVIGADPSLVEIGMVLRLPCLDGDNNPAQAAAQIVTETDSLEVS